MSQYRKLLVEDRQNVVKLKIILYFKIIEKSFLDFCVNCITTLPNGKSIILNFPLLYKSFTVLFAQVISAVFIFTKTEEQKREPQFIEIILTRQTGLIINKGFLITKMFFLNTASKPFVQTYVQCPFLVSKVYFLCIWTQVKGPMSMLF